MIRLEGLRVQAGPFTLRIDDLSIAQGEYVMILGPTASGKTVLLETIAGLRRPKDGRVWFDGRDVTVEAPEKRGVGLVYQDYALFPHLSVADNIAFGLRSRGGRAPTKGGTGRTAGGRERELAALLGIEALLRRYPEHLSGGERQRVALARALAIEPEVLLLDEPLSALDGPTRTELQRELKRVHHELGATVLHVTHDLDEALALGGRVAVLIGGGLRQVGPPGQVIRFPADADVARLVGLANLLPVVSWEGGRALLESGHELLTGRPDFDDRPERSFAVVHADEIEIAPVASPSTEPAANLLRGTVGAVRIQSAHASVEVEIPPAGPGSSVLVLVVHVLRPQVENLGITPGSLVWLRFPGEAVHVCREGAQSVP